MRKFAIAAAAALLPAFAASAQDYKAHEALTHARVIETAWHTLAGHILHDSTAATSWTGTAPPAATGWRADWTARGLGALYCGDILVVFAANADLKGVGDDQRAIRLAPHLEAESESRTEPPLHWLAAGSAEGILGRDSVALPACMGTAPTDRVALAGVVIDPFGVANHRVTLERQARACPAGTHGTGQTWVRQISQPVNGRGDDDGAATIGAWTLQVDHCTADYSEWMYYRLACTFSPGPPHAGTLSGEAVWRRQRTVTSAGETWSGAPVFVSTSCWTDPNPTPPVPRDWTTSSTSTRTVGCPSPQIGQRTQRRSTSRFYRQWPWDSSPTLMRNSTTPWTQTASTCRQPPPPPQCPPGQDGTPPNCSTPPREEEEREENKKKPCVERDKGGGCPDSGGGGNDRDGPGGGWDTDGDGRADYGTYGEIPDGKKGSAVAVTGPDPVPGRGGGGDGPSKGGPSNGNDGNSGGNGCGCGGPGGGGPGDVGGGGGGVGGGGGPGGAPGSGDRGR